jgi:hypothetical protein
VCLQGPALLAAASAAWLALRLSTAAPRGDRVNAPPLRLEVAPGTEAAAQRRLAEALDPLGVRGDRVEVVADPTVAAGAARLVRGRALLHAGALEPAFLAAMRRLAAPLLVTTQDVAEALDTLEGRAPVLVRAVVPSRVDLLGLTRVTRALLAEGLPVDDLERVLDALSYLPVDTNDLERARAARRAFADHLTARVHGARGAQAACAGLELESALRRGALSPEGRTELLDQLGALRNETPDLCVVCAPDVRAALAALTADPLPTLEVVGLDELLARGCREHGLFDVPVGEHHAQRGRRLVGVPLQLDKSVATEGVFDLRADDIGDVELGQAAEAVDDLFEGHARAGGVPQRERRDAVGVHHLWRRLNLGKTGEEVAGSVEFAVLCLQHDLSVSLDPHRVRRVHVHVVNSIGTGLRGACAWPRVASTKSSTSVYARWA